MTIRVTSGQQKQLANETQKIAERKSAKHLKILIQIISINLLIFIHLHFSHLCGLWLDRRLLSHI
jgi:hypothetical protein